MMKKNTLLLCLLFSCTNMTEGANNVHIPHSSDDKIHARTPERHDSDTRMTIPVTKEELLRAPDGPFETTWESVAANYHVPEWFMNAKFGIFIHWGPYSVPATGSEWYPRHMYNGLKDSHRNHWGKQSEFGYKDFITLFKAEKFNPQEWASLFHEAGARYVIPTAEHHDGFAMYDSRLTEWNAVKKGPKRDIIGDLAAAVRAVGLKFGVSNHRVENWDFMYPSLAPDSTDLFRHEYAALYGPPQKPTDQSGMGPAEGKEGHHPQSDAFMNEWQVRVMEIIDRYKPDLLYFDNGINYRSMDPWKLRIARYYYNSATQWGKEVSIQSKGKAYLAGSIQDFERESRAPKTIYANYWQVDDPIGHKFGYVEGLRLQSADRVIRNLIDNISANGNLCLNISPKSDGTIPQDQQDVLRAIGKWLNKYGEAVYDTRAWTTHGEGNVRYTCKGKRTVFIFVKNWNGKPFTIKSLNANMIDSIESLANGKRIGFEQTDNGLKINAADDMKDAAAVFKVTLQLNDN